MIASEDYQDKIPAGTLNRFALSDGEWLPKDEYQVLLGIKRQRKSAHQSTPKDLWDMATDKLRYALEHREECPPIDPRIMKAFVKLGWMEKAV